MRKTRAKVKPRTVDEYPGAHQIKMLEDELEGYETSKGTIRFPYRGASRHKAPPGVMA